MRTDRQDIHTQTRVTTIHFLWSTTHTKCNYQAVFDATQTHHADTAIS